MGEPRTRHWIEVFPEEDRINGRLVCEHPDDCRDTSPEYRYGVQLDNAHSSSDDALAAARVAWKLAHRYPEIGDLDLSVLHDRQVDWRARQCASLQAHIQRMKRKDGAPAEEIAAVHIDPSWTPEESSSMTTTVDLSTIRLDKGAHDTPDDGMCLMEAVAYVRGIEFSDHPPCVSQVLGTFGRNLNDVLPDDTRQQLVPLIPRLPGTAGDGQDEARSYMALDWLIRTYTPAWLDLAGLTAEAQALRDLRRIVDRVTAQSAGPVVRDARTKAAAAWAAAGDAAWDAARAAAGAAAGDAAWDAAWDALRPTVTDLQASAIVLYEAMIDPASAA